jgi:FkbM family methyltransferase
LGAANVDLFVNPVGRFARWVIARGLLHSDFVLVDGGVQGGIAPRWDTFRDRLVVYGFDPIKETIEPLRARAKTKDHFLALALGNEDGERDLFIPEISFAASFHHRGFDGLDVPGGLTKNVRTRTVPIRRLDSLMNEGTVERADMIKLDCEGFEPEIIDGAQEFLKKSQPIGFECETSFRTSNGYQEPHFLELYRRLSPFGFKLCDLAFGRTPYANFVKRARALRRKIIHRTLVARPDVFNVVFYRDLTNAVPTTDQVLKQAMMFEAYGMRDSAYELLVSFAHLFRAEVCIQDGADLLTKWAGRLRHLVPVRPTRL